MQIDQTFAAPLRRRWPKMLRRADASKYLLEEHGVHQSPATLAKKFTLGGGPNVVHLAGIPYYTRDALDAWVSENSTRPRRSSSEKALLGV